jgi:hypothetical protein
VEAPDLATIKDFFRFHIATSCGRIVAKPTVDSINTNGVSVPTPNLSLFSADLYQSNATAVADERIHQHSSIPPKGNNLEEPLSQPRSQSRTEARLPLASNPQLPVDGMNAEPVGLVANTSTVSLDLGNQEQAGNILTPEGSTFYSNLLSPD